jgi:predicted acetyltransferase
MDPAETLHVGAPGGATDLAAFAPILEASLAFPASFAPTYFEWVGAENLRVAKRGGAVVGGTAIYPMGQWFGGRSVPMGGVAAVAVAPEHRATGVGGALMVDALRECARRGLPISTLYPATYPVYRRAGYECAGTHTLHRVRPAAIDARDRGPPVRPMTEADVPAVVELAAERGRRTAGTLDRSPYLWRRVRTHPTQTVHAYVVDGAWGGAPEGYVFYRQEYAKAGSNHYDLWVRDLAATTPAAARRLLSFLASHRSMADVVLLPAAASDPLLLHLADAHDEIERRWEWMTRIVDVEAALAARGYAREIEAEVHLEVEDDLFEANAGRFVLAVRGGRGEVERGGRGAVRLHVGALAPLYTGHHSAEALLVTGRVQGAPPDLAAASAVFAGPAPWMPEVF